MRHLQIFNLFFQVKIFKLEVTRVLNRFLIVLGKLVAHPHFEN